MYEQDFDERTAAVWDTPYNSTYASRTWMDMLLPYVKNSEIFSCPSSPYKYRSTATGHYGSYGANRMYVNVPSSSIIYAYRMTATLEQPSMCLLASDSPSGNIFVRQMEYQPPDIHNGGSNVAFFDGHAKWLARETLLKADRDLWCGGMDNPYGW